MTQWVFVIWFLMHSIAVHAQQKPLVPQIDGEWWQIAKNPVRIPCISELTTTRTKSVTLPVAAPEVFLFNGQWYIASTMPDYGGIHLAKLKWVPQP
jgi:hypothetical protein